MNHGISNLATYPPYLNTISLPSTVSPQFSHHGEMWKTNHLIYHCITIDGKLPTMEFPLIYPLVIKHSYGKSPYFNGKTTMFMAIFHSHVSHYQRVNHHKSPLKFHLITIKITISLPLRPLWHHSLHAPVWRKPPDPSVPT